jgi:hypothetical protein
MQIENAVGPQIAADGTFPKSRATRDASSGVQDTHGHFQEAVGRGNVYTAVTGVAGVAPGTVLSTTPPFTLSNPLGSGVNLVVLVAEFLFISGTIGAGTVYYGVNNAPGQAAPTGGTALTPINNIVGNTGAGKGKAAQGATIPANMTPFAPAFVFLGTVAGSGVIKDLVDGAIVIAPGNYLSLQGVMAAGSSPLAGFSVTWEEVPQIAM